jgi:hypothetical protein
MRTGTNYVSSLIKNNFSDTTVFMNIGGWKHGKIIEFPNDIELVNKIDITTKNNIDIDKTIDLFTTNKVIFLIMVKNPYIKFLQNDESKEKLNNFNTDLVAPSVPVEVLKK